MIDELGEHRDRALRENTVRCDGEGVLLLVVRDIWRHDVDELPQILLPWVSFELSEELADAREVRIERVRANVRTHGVERALIETWCGTSGETLGVEPS